MIGKQASKKRLQIVKAKKIAIFIQKSNQQGFTIIESLVAIIVVSILLAAIAPVLSISVATRVQARRVEFAVQAARSYIDGVTTKVISPPANTGTQLLKDFPVPTASGSLDCEANSYCTTTGATSTTPTNLYCLDFNNDGKCLSSSPTDMVVQAFRYDLNNTPEKGYPLGVRVYRADAFRGNSTLSKNTATSNAVKTKATQNTFSGGMGQRTAPLLEMTTDINNTLPKWSDLCGRIRGSNTSDPLNAGCTTN